MRQGPSADPPAPSCRRQSRSPAIPARRRCFRHPSPRPLAFVLRRRGPLLPGCYCLGAALARLEGRIALEEILNRFPEWDVDMSKARMSTTLYRARLGNHAGLFGLSRDGDTIRSSSRRRGFRGRGYVATGAVIGIRPGAVQSLALAAPWTIFYRGWSSRDPPRRMRTYRRRPPLLLSPCLSPTLRPTQRVRFR